MKLFCNILAVYMMVLFLMPCADMQKSDGIKNLDNLIEITQRENHTHSEQADSCTPFCLCGCCGVVYGIVLQLNTFYLPKTKSFDFSTSKGYYTSSFISRYFGEIWQPPKINA